MYRVLTYSLALVFSASANFILAEENWPQWRGPLGTGVAADGEYPVKFSPDEGLGWKLPLPGAGTSTPQATTRRPAPAIDRIDRTMPVAIGAVQPGSKPPRARAGRVKRASLARREDSNTASRQHLRIQVLTSGTAGA